MLHNVASSPFALFFLFSSSCVSLTTMSNLPLVVIRFCQGTRGSCGPDKLFSQVKVCTTEALQKERSNQCVKSVFEMLYFITALQMCILMLSGRKGFPLLRKRVRLKNNRICMLPACHVFVVSTTKHHRRTPVGTNILRVYVSPMGASFAGALVSKVFSLISTSCASTPEAAQDGAKLPGDSEVG